MGLGGVQSEKKVGGGGVWTFPRTTHYNMLTSILATINQTLDCLF